jgi:cholesterol transport system auxiliary component
MISLPALLRHSPKLSPRRTHTGRIIAAALLLALTGCSALKQTATPPPAFYSLDNTRSEAKTGRPASSPPPTQTLIVNPPHAASGFDSQRIIYVRETHQLEYYAHSEWADTPARMLAPLVVAALENSGTFRAVVLTPSTAAGELRLDTEIIRLQHELGNQPGRVRFTLRAYVVDDATRRVLAWREFDETVASASNDPYGSIVAANRAVQAALAKLSDFCSETARNAAISK